MASSGSIYSNLASGSFTSSGTKYSFSDAQWYITWTQSHVSNGRSKVEFLVYTTKSNKSPRNMNTKGTITITAKTGTIVSGNTSLDFGNKTRAYAISGGSNIVPQSTATNKVAETYSFLIDHDASGAAAFTVAFRFDIAVGAWNCTGGGDGTLDANHWNRTLTLNKGTGIYSTSGGGTIRGGTSVTASATVLPGYSFSKWTNSSGTQLSTSSSYTFTMPTSNTTYTANATVNSYTFTFNANGGSVSPTTKSVTYGGVATGLPTPTRSGYAFQGWYLNFNGSTSYNLGRNYMYTNKLSVHLEAYMDNWANFGDARLISCTNSGGWNIEPNGNYVQFAGYDSGVGYKAATTTVTWASLGSGWHSFDLIFDGSKLHGYIDGSLKASSAAYSSGAIGYTGNSIILGAEAGNGLTSVDGAYFVGKIRNVVINNNSTRVTNATNSYIVPASNATLYADWLLSVYTINLDGNGGTLPWTSKTVNAGSAVTLPTASECSKRGSELLGFGTTSTATSATYSPGASYTVSTNGATLYAIWMTGNQIYVKTSSGWKLGKVYIKYNGTWLGG